MTVMILNGMSVRKCLLILPFSQCVFAFNSEEIGQEAFIIQLKDILASANINQVKSDVPLFVRNSKGLGICSNDYFVQLVDMVKFE